MGDRDKIYPSKTNPMSSRQVMRKKINWGLLVDPVPNSLSELQKNFKADIEENCY